MTTRSHKGLVQRDVTVKRGGKTFTQKRWVKAGEDEPEEKKGKKVDLKSTGKFNIGDKILFMGNNLTIMKVSESEETVKLSDGKVYTFGAIEKFSEKPEKKAKDLKEDEKETEKEVEGSIKDLKLREKKPEKEIKRVIPGGTLITPENLEETVQVGSHITLMGDKLTVMNRNGSILKLFDLDGNEHFGSTIGIMEMGATVREETPKDKKIKAKEEKILKAAEKKVKDREKQFGKKRKIKSIGAESPSIQAELGMKIDMGFGTKSIDSITPEGIMVGNILFDHIEVHTALNENVSLVTGDKVNSKYIITNNKEHDAKISATINKLDNLMLDGASLNDAVSEVVGGGKDNIKIDLDIPTFETSEKKEVKKGINRLNACLSPKFKDLKVKVVPCTTGRSYATNDNQVHLDNEFDVASTLMHEVGHLIEDQYENTHNAIDGFLRSRTTNLSGQEKLNDVFPRGGYCEDEITCKDDFINPYIGKLYYKSVESGKIDTKDLYASEVFSMGIQKFINEDEMRELYSQDKEHFALTLSIMAGDFIE